jgi:predicted MPP superfamily phosphohydrolase
MRRKSLPAPRPALRTAEARIDDGTLAVDSPFASGGSPGSDAPFEREALGLPTAAGPRLRRLFDPVTGWFRRLERRGNFLLSRHVYARLPGLDRPYGWQLERSLTVSEATIELPGLSPAFDGTRVLFFSDMHAGPFLTPAALRRTLRRLLSLRPDLVLVGGDFTTTHNAELVPFQPVLAELSAPLGVFGVLGNHDHYTEDTRRLAEMIEETGVRLLHNDAVAVERNGGRLVLAGIDDLYCGRPDLPRALGAARAIGDVDPVVLLSHNPDVFFDAAAEGVSLVLAGHTHAGQVRIPGLPVLSRMSRYRLDEGRFRFERAELLVSRGLGVVGLPLRTFCPPEALLIELRRA